MAGEADRLCRGAEAEAEALASSGFNIGHLTIGVALAYLDFRFAELAWRDGHPKLAAWHETFDMRPSVQAENMPVDNRSGHHFHGTFGVKNV